MVARTEPIHDTACMKIIAMASQLSDDPIIRDGVETDRAKCHGDVYVLVMLVLMMITYVR